jgi:predicted TIM-barrel fold metal-dependent hydrolase
MDRDTELYKEWDAPFLTMKPSEYFVRNCYVGTEADEAELHHVVDSVGDQNVVFSSDYPHHDSEFPESVVEFLRNDKLSDETKRAVLWDNTARLYALD